ncbi:MAG: tetratricopeptide repeat protein [Acidimicrobiales bacterium]
MIDVTDASFETDVLQRSMQIPVVVDLWAPWCGPCKTLGPMIEKVIDDANVGAETPRVVLAKINVDENPMASQAFRVQSIPAVYALSNGQIVDGFTGAQPEQVIREFVSKLVPSGKALEIATLLQSGTEADLLQVLELEPGHHDATVALAQHYVDEHRYQEALDALAKIPETEPARVVGALARVGLQNGSPENLEVEAELEQLLDRVKEDDEARSRFVDLLAVLGNDHPNTAAWRKKLSTRLF